MRVVAPSGSPSRVPVVIGIAGYDQTRQFFDNEAQLTSRLGNALVAVVEGVGKPQTWQFREGQTRDVTWLSAVVTSLTRSCGDSNRVELAGLSDGGVMAVRAACSMGGRIRALVTSSASSVPPKGCSIPSVVYAQHGTADQLDPYDGAGKDIPPARSGIAAWAQAAGCSESSDEETSSGVHDLAYSSCARSESVSLITLDGAPHGWPRSFDLTGHLPELMAGSGPAPTFLYQISAVSAKDLPHSWHQGCPVAPSGLRRILMNYWGFDAQTHTGELIVNADSTTSMISVFHTLFNAKYPIRQLRSIDEFNGSDDESTTADNTSGFNCREAVGGSGWSQHAYGHAVDVNPVENPYIDNGKVLPSNGKPYVDRSQQRPGMIHGGDVVDSAFASVGWKWGGRWGSTPDYQHFSSTGT